MTKVFEAGESLMNPAMHSASARVRSSAESRFDELFGEALIEALMLNSERMSVRTS